MTKQRVVLERTYKADIEDVWDLWTTKDGIESWWGPEGFGVEVVRVDLRVGGSIEYAMFAHAPEMIAFMKQAGMPVRRNHLLRFTEVKKHERLVYLHLVDFTEAKAYDVEHSVEFHVNGDDVRLVISFEAMHDDVWTQRAKQGWESELRKLEKAIER